MTILASRAQLERLRAELRASFEPQKRRVSVCMGTGCKACGGDELLQGLDTALREAGLADEVEVVKTGCRGFCENGTLVSIRPEGTLYCKVKPEDIADIVGRTVAKGERVERLLYELPGAIPGLPGRRFRVPNSGEFGWPLNRLSRNHHGLTPQMPVNIVRATLQADACGVWGCGAVHF